VKLHAEQPFRVIGVNTDRDHADYEKRAKDSEIGWRNVWCGGPGGGVPAAFGIQAYPTVILVDKAGVARWQGNFFAGDEGFAGILAELLAEPH